MIEGEYDVRSDGDFGKLPTQGEPNVREGFSEPRVGDREFSRHTRRTIGLDGEFFRLIECHESACLQRRIFEEQAIPSWTRLPPPHRVAERQSTQRVSRA